jgi:1-acyl-sn-glycerol-3-phosphate acyltransferase
VTPAPFDTNDLDARDPQLIARVLPFVRWYLRRYVRLQVTGSELLQPGAALVVGNHNGGICGPDLLATLGVLWTSLGPETAVHALAHDFAMQQLTPLGRLLQCRPMSRTPARPLARAGRAPLTNLAHDLNANDAQAGRRQGAKSRHPSACLAALV